jgi:hypothetical protein
MNFRNSHIIKSDAALSANRRGDIHTLAHAQRRHAVPVSAAVDLWHSNYRIAVYRKILFSVFCFSIALLRFSGLTVCFEELKHSDSSLSEFLVC